MAFLHHSTLYLEQVGGGESGAKGDHQTDDVVDEAHGLDDGHAGMPVRPTAVMPTLAATT